jgi:hypothetical protein
MTLWTCVLVVLRSIVSAVKGSAVPRVLFLVVAVLAAVSVSSVRAQDATPVGEPTFDSGQATLDAFATQEAIDLTEIAGGESEIETELAWTPYPADATPTEDAVAVTQLPDAGTGSSSGSMAAVLAVIGVLLSGAWLALRRTA